jgi:fidgetin-like protein 1
MELQCKERVDLFGALRQSRVDAKKDDGNPLIAPILPEKPTLPRKRNVEAAPDDMKISIAQESIPTMNYSDLSRPTAPPLPPRPPILQNIISHSPIIERSQSSPQIVTPSPSLPYPTPTLPVPAKNVSRTPSPEKKGRMLTTLRGNKDAKKKPSRSSGGRKSSPPAASWKAAGLAWDTVSSRPKIGRTLSGEGGKVGKTDDSHWNGSGDEPVSRRGSNSNFDKQGRAQRTNGMMLHPNASESDLASLQDLARPYSYHSVPADISQRNQGGTWNSRSQMTADAASLKLNTSTHQGKAKNVPSHKDRLHSPTQQNTQPGYPSYRNEYQSASPSAKAIALSNAVKSGKQREGAKPSVLAMRQRSPQRIAGPAPPSSIARRPIASGSPRVGPRARSESAELESSESADDSFTSAHVKTRKTAGAQQRGIKSPAGTPSTVRPSSAQADQDSSEASLATNTGGDRIRYVKRHLPKGVDENAAKQIFNEIVVEGDEVHWEDVAGLDVAKAALKEAVVYPFLRPDLFLGLREPARGMLLFGPPGTGKTMLARAVATESRSTFFAISASSLTSKWLGESEKLVRALFALAKALAPSIIFVDEIDSLLSSRGSSEHDSTRRIKTEFLIQWSDLQRAAAGKVQSEKEKQEGDASRVLVLAATNMPWAIDEAARRRFVRRQYIPLPEDQVRGTQLRTLLGHQKHNINNDDIEVLVALTDGWSSI